MSAITADILEETVLSAASVAESTSDASMASCRADIRILLRSCTRSPSSNVEYPTFKNSRISPRQNNFVGAVTSTVVPFSFNTSVCCPIISMHPAIRPG
eukprot:scaffold264260_cov76-Cyclotella_meneghiniana.AAC.4